jgi:acyl-CoA synthetase (AMP-forming)/AMP-acid ligase II
MPEVSQESRAEKPGHFLHALRATFVRQADRPALLYQDRSFTFGELDARARRCARRLRQLGVEPGDRIAIATPEKLPFLAAHLGAFAAAAVSLPLNPRFTAGELLYFLQDSGARVAVVGDQQGAIVESLRTELPELRAVRSGKRDRSGIDKMGRFWLCCDDATNSKGRSRGDGFSRIESRRCANAVV